MSRQAGFAVIVLALALGACATSGASAEGSGTDAQAQTQEQSGPRSDRNTLVAADLQRSQATNLYDIIRALRPQWLDVRPQAGGDPIQVYMDDNRLGGIEVLRTMTTTNIRTIRWLDPSAAQGRYGLNNRGGAIAISTERTRR